jgi:phenylalanyl-tRNA synthetase alpha chain
MNENTRATETLARIEHLQIDAEGKLTQIDTEEALHTWHRCYLGRVGAVTELLRGISALPPAQRPNVGHAANRLRQRLEAAGAKRERELRDLRLQRSLRSAALDVTLPGRAPPTGRLHPMTLILREMVTAFRTMGFQVMTGPEIETDDHNFTLLNMPPNHPARDMHDTFYVDAEASGLPRATNWVLRTHTSPNQVRVMWQQDPPIRVVVPGACYRLDNPDPSHDWMFYQMEGFAIVVWLNDSRAVSRNLFSFHGAQS